MAWTAIYQDDECGAFEVPFQTDAYCKECGERMRVWREGSDGTARHFKHVSEMQGGSGSSTVTSCSGGESDQHQKWKNFAAERLFEIFGDADETTVEKRLAAPHTGKKHRDADAAVIFDERDEQLGLGLAVEVQHKNRDKDIEATTLDYLKQDIAVAWVEADDFWERGCRLNETDFRDRATESVDSILLDQNPVPWYLHIDAHAEPKLHAVRNAREELNQDDCNHELQERKFSVPAKLPNEVFDDEALRIWRSQEWRDLFNPAETPRYITQTVIPKTDSTRVTEINLPNDFFTELRRQLWFNTSFENILSPPKEYEFDYSYPIEAAFPADWDYKRDFKHLNENNSDRSCGICNGSATVYVHEVGFRCGDCGPWPNSRKSV